MYHVLPFRPSDSWKKVPNILIYTGRRFHTALYNDIRCLLRSLLGADSYTIYHLQHEHISAMPWEDNCELVVIATQQVSDWGELVGK